MPKNGDLQLLSTFQAEHSQCAFCPTETIGIHCRNVKDLELVKACVMQSGSALRFGAYPAIMLLQCSSGLFRTRLRTVLRFVAPELKANKDIAA